MIRMRFSQALITICLGCLQSAVAYSDDEVAKEIQYGVVLTWLHKESDLLVESLILKESSTDAQVKIPASESPILMEIPAGSYYVRQIRSIYRNVMPAKLQKPKHLLVISAGKINYIGDLVITNQSKRSSRISSSLMYDYREETIAEAAKRYPDKMLGRETVLSIAGRESQVIDVQAMLENTNSD